MIKMKTAIIFVAFAFFLCTPTAGSRAIDEIRKASRTFWVDVHSFVPINADGTITVAGRNCISPLQKSYAVITQFTQRVPFSRAGWNCYVQEVTATLSNGVQCTPFTNQSPYHYWLSFQITGDETNCIVTHYR